MSRNLGPRARWAALGAGVTAYELYTIYNEADGDTLSEVVREIVRPDTPSGAAKWTIGWWSFVAAGGWWFWRHILDEDSVPCLDKRRPR